MSELTTGRAVVLYVGALLGPSVLVLPGLAVQVAGPASIVAWCGLLALSGLLAWMFSALGTRLPARGGAAGYVGAAFGARAERVVGACFAAGVVAGAPVVCLIGGGYVAAAVGGGRTVAVVAAVAMLVTVVALTLGGTKASAAVQLVLVGTLVALVVIAVLGAAPHAHAANFHAFAPHGWAAVGHAGALLMLSFVGWEAIAPLIGRLRDRQRQLPRVIAAAFAVTAVLYLGLAVTTVAALGPHGASRTPVADLLTLAIGRFATVAAAVAAVALTLAGVNAYLTGASEMLTALRAPAEGSAQAGADPDPDTDAARRTRRYLPLAVAVVGAAVLGAVGAGWLTTEQLVAVPTVLFVSVYVGCTFAGVRVLHGPVRIAAAIGAVAVLVVAAFSGWALVIPVVVAVVTLARRRTAACRRSSRLAPLLALRGRRQREVRGKAEVRSGSSGTEFVAGAVCEDGIRC